MASRSRIGHALLEWLAERVGPLLVRLVGVTLRTRKKGLENVARAREIAGNVIYAFWHGRLLALSYLHRNEGINVLVSTHRDGEYIARIIHGLGFATSRGSSTRGGTRAIIGLIEAGARENDLAITPDGPRGPLGRCQPGVIYLAKRSGLPVVPVGVCHRPSLVLRSWDRFMLPLPFARGLVVYGEPAVYDPSVSEDAIVEAQKDLERRLWAVNEEADHACGRRPE
jgi:lysophospholipid acyltransferase (LPLAT)-like uncharacterized protein